MQLEQILLTFLFFLCGIIIGSFANVCIDRISEHKNIVTANFHCISCGHKLVWYDMIPLVSWLSLRGKCHYCGEKISRQYPLVELVSGVGYVWIFLVSGIGSDCIFYCLTFSALVVLSVIDWRTFEIPVGINIFIASIGALATIYDLVVKEPYSLWNHLIGAISVSLFLYILYVVTDGRGIGGGDVKLMAAAGLLIGWQRILLALFLGAILGSIIHIARMKISGKEHMLAFGPYLSAGIFLSILYGNELIHWYLGFFPTRFQV